MATILLIRHGENDFTGKTLVGRMPGVHLNDRGREQAKLITSSLRDAPLKAIYSSPLERAVETAQPLADAFGLPIRIRPALAEVDFGDWQGISARSMRRRKLFHLVLDHPSQACFPGGESFVQAQARVAAGLEEINRAHHPRDLVACFSHADVIKLALAYYLGLPLDNFQRLALGTASISVLALGKKGDAAILAVNQVFSPVFSRPKNKKAAESSAAPDAT